jgi:hypothetical protein
MTLSNSQREIVEGIERKFAKINQRYSQDPCNLVASAIQAIEMSNRGITWRICEYIALAVYSVLYISTKQIDNLSIGVCQLKLSQILTFLDIDFCLESRALKIQSSGFFPFWKVIATRNSRPAILALMENEQFCFLHNDRVDMNKLKYFVEEYSRTLPTDSGFSYYYVLNRLLSLRIRGHQYAIAYS